MGLFPLPLVIENHEFYNPELIDSLVVSAGKGTV